MLNLASNGPVIIGAISDPQVNAVVQAMGSRMAPVVLDALTLTATEISDKFE